MKLTYKKECQKYARLNTKSEFRYETLQSLHFLWSSRIMKYWRWAVRIKSGAQETPQSVYDTIQAYLKEVSRTSVSFLLHSLCTPLQIHCLKALLWWLVCEHPFSPSEEKSVTELLSSFWAIHELFMYQLRCPVSNSPSASGVQRCAPFLLGPHAKTSQLTPMVFIHSLHTKSYTASG